MKKHPLVWAIVVVVVAAGAAFWWLTAPGPGAKTSLATFGEAKAGMPPPPPAPKPATVAAPRPALVQPPPTTAPVAAADPTSATASAPSPPEAQVKAAVGDLLRVLDTGDYATFVQSYIVPGMRAELAMQAEAVNLPADAPEVESMVQQLQASMMQQMAQDPKARQGFQDLAAALRAVQDSPPEFNAAGDRAVYKLTVVPGADVPPSVPFMLQDGKWALDLQAMGEWDGGF